MIPSPVALKTHRVASSCSRTAFSPISRFSKRIISISRYPRLMQALYVHCFNFSLLFFYAEDSLCSVSFTCSCWHARLAVIERVWIHKGPSQHPPSVYCSLPMLQSYGPYFCIVIVMHRRSQGVQVVQMHPQGHIKIVVHNFVGRG